MSEISQTERVSDEELDQMIWKLERDGMTPKQLSLMRELRELRRAKGEPVAYADQQSFINFKSEGGKNAACTKEWMWRDSAVGLIPLYTAQPAPVAPDMFMPKNLDRALGVVGVALPESKEEFNFQIERWTQRLIDRVIRYADEFRESPAPVVDADDNFYSWFGREWHEHYQQNQYTTAAKQMLGVMAESAWKAGRAAMLQADGTLTNEDTMQSPGNSEQLEPVSNRDELPAKCWCQTCRPVTMNDMRFVVCPECGNKRCPRANDHRNACTGSNAPGQDGGAYPAAPKEVR